MKNKQSKTSQNPKISLLIRVVSPKYISLTGKFDPIINRTVKRIIKLSS